ncbi:MAG: hypothetical protein O9322_05610 [Beijerinckiaceae bacterium]|nr:hypothetical protein [Beijerinckiaceae bacterium]MCZ8298998.1 hypothetical protein [Beijerinckiaceae bacterium]
MMREPDFEGGYVLLDALVGIALTGMVLAFAFSAMREISTMRDRLATESRERRELASAVSTIRNRLENAHAARRQDNDSEVGSFRQITFATRYSAAADAGQHVPLHLTIEADRAGRDELLLELGHLGSRQREARLLSSAKIELHSSASDNLFAVRDIELSIARTARSTPLTLRFSQPRYTRVFCVAAPFDPSCQP